METHQSSRAVLPSSHVFLTVSRGASHRTVMVRTAVAWSGLLLMPVLALWLVGTTGYVLFHDTLVSAVMEREREMQYGYEDRISALQTALNRATTEGMMTRRSVTSRLDELETRERELLTRSGSLAELDRAAAGAMAVAGIVPPPAGSRARAASEPSSPSQSGSDPLSPGAHLPDDHAEDAAALRSVQVAGTTLDAIATAQDEHLATLGRSVGLTRDRLRGAIEATGLSVERVLRTEPQKAVGGPLVLLPQEAPPSRFGQAAFEVEQGLGEVGRLAAAMSRVPLRKPLRGDPEITSPFGERIDPFLGRPALHTGLDLREDTGTEVFATAPGRVVAAGPASGYGLMVAIDHGGGLETRYAHLSRIEASVGQVLKVGDPLGEVGATGRATGPHLHYETRIDGEPVDPLRFILAGQKIFGRGDG